MIKINGLPHYVRNEVLKYTHRRITDKHLDYLKICKDTNRGTKFSIPTRQDLLKDTIYTLCYKPSINSVTFSRNSAGHFNGFKVNQHGVEQTLNQWQFKNFGDLMGCKNKEIKTRNDKLVINDKVMRIKVYKKSSCGIT